MFLDTIYIALVMSVLISLMFLSLFIILLCYSWLKGAPYVSTQNHEIDEILKNAQLLKDCIFIELGCGDGRVVRHAAKHYNVKGIGVDINPFLILLAKMRSRTISNLSFIKGNILEIDLSQADYIYLFLFPRLINTLQKQLFSVKKGALIISHGFRIPFLKEYLILEINGAPFKTFFYKLNQVNSA